MWHRSQGIETMRKIASWISRAPFPYSPQGDETIRYILYGVSRTFSSYCRILDSKGPFSSWIQLCRVYVSKSCPLNFSPFFFSSDFSRGDKQYSQQCWSVNRFYDDYGDNGYGKKKKKKKSSKKYPYVQNNTSLADVQTTPKYLLLQISLWIPSTWTHSTIFIRHESCMDFWYDSLISIAAPMTTLE